MAVIDGHRWWVLQSYTAYMLHLSIIFTQEELNCKRHWMWYSLNQNAWHDDDGGDWTSNIRGVFGNAPSVVAFLQWSLKQTPNFLNNEIASFVFPNTQRQSMMRISNLHLGRSNLNQVPKFSCMFSGAWSMQWMYTLPHNNFCRNWTRLNKLASGRMYSSIDIKSQTKS